MRAGDLPAAQRELARATTAWPPQPEYAWAAAFVAAKAHDTSGVVASLERFAGYQLGRDVRANPDLAPFVFAPQAASVISRLDANRAPLARSQPFRTLPDSTFWPEGLDVDPRSGTFYVASVRHRVVAEVARDGKVRELWPRGRPEFGAMLAVRFDARRGTLWATTSGLPQMLGFNPGDSTIAALLEVRIKDGAIVRRFNLPAGGHHTLGDVAIGARGDVFVTDSDEPWLYRLRPGADSLERITSPLFRSLQGIAPAPDGQTLVVADYSHGLLRVDLGSGRVARIADVAGTTSLGCDGILWYKDGIVAVQNGVSPPRIVRFSLNAARTAITSVEILDRNSTIADEPTIGTLLADSFVYVANSQWEKYLGDGQRKPGVALTAPVLLSLPLSRHATPP